MDNRAYMSDQVPVKDNGLKQSSNMDTVPEHCGCLSSQPLRLGFSIIGQTEYCTVFHNLSFVSLLSLVVLQS